MRPPSPGGQPRWRLEGCCGRGSVLLPTPCISTRALDPAGRPLCAIHDGDGTRGRRAVSRRAAPSSRTTLSRSGLEAQRPPRGRALDSRPGPDLAAGASSGCAAYMSLRPRRRMRHVGYPAGTKSSSSLPPPPRLFLFLECRAAQASLRQGRRAWSGVGSWLSIEDEFVIDASSPTHTPPPSPLPLVQPLSVMLALEDLR